jgi:MFS family permease
LEEPLVERVNTETGQQPAVAKLDFPRLSAALLANGLLRIASSTEGFLIGFYLAYLATHGRPVDAALLGALGVVINASELLSAIPIGILTDRIPIRAVLVGGALLGAVASQLFAFTGLIAIFYISRALEGISNASSSPPLLVHLTDITEHDPTTRGRVMSFFQVSLLTGIALGGLVAGVLWTAIRIYAFSVLAGLYLLVAVLFYWGVRPHKGSPAAGHLPDTQTHTPAHALSGFFQALSDPLVRRLAPAWVAMNAIVGLWLTHVSFQLSGLPITGQYLTGRFTPRQVGMILLGYAIRLPVAVPAQPSFDLVRAPAQCGAAPGRPIGYRRERVYAGCAFLPGRRGRQKGGPRLGHGAVYFLIRARQPAGSRTRRFAGAQICL